MRDFGRMYQATTVRPDVHARVQAIVQRVDERLAKDWAWLLSQVSADTLEQHTYWPEPPALNEPEIAAAFRSAPGEAVEV